MLKIFLNSMFMQMLVMYLVSFYLVFGFDEWFLVWLGLELNMISFLVLSYSSENICVVEAMGKYFFVQSLGSGMLLGMFYIGWSDIVWVVLLSMKMGAGPFYFWFIGVVKSFKWIVNLILMVFQKIMLLLLMSELMSIMVVGMGLMSMVVGVLGVFNQVSLKAIMGYSSVFHTGWMMCLLLDGSKMWWLYLLVYGLMMWGAVGVIIGMNLVFLNGGLMSYYKKSLMIMMLNLGGVPPMTGFVLKWVAFYVLWDFDFGVLLIMMVMSVMMLYVYLRVLYDTSLGGVMMMGWGVGLIQFSWGEILSFSGLLFLGVLI